MKYLSAIAALFLAVTLSANDFVNPVVLQEIGDMLSKDQISSGKIMFRVDRYLLIDDEEKNPAPVPTDADKKNGFVVFKRSWMAPILWNTRPAKSELAPKSFDYFAAPGHYGDLTVGLIPLETGDMKVSVPDLKSAGGETFKSENIEVSSVRHLVKKAQDGICKVLPEMVVKGNTVKLYKDVARQVWLIINVPEGTKPGLYEGDLSFALAGKEKRLVRIKVEVLPFKLLTDPDKGFGWFCSPTDEVGLKDYLKHEFNSVAGFTCPVKSVSGGKVVMDFKPLDSYAETLKKVGFSSNVKHIASVINIFQNLNHLGLQDFSPEYNAAYKDALAQMQARATEKKLKLVYWLVDEPRDTMLAAWNRTIADTIKIAKLAAEVKGIESYQDIMQDSQYNDGQLADFIKYFDVLSPHCAKQYCPKIISETKKAKKQLWFYNTSVGRFGFSTWKHGAVGRTEWAYNCGLTEATAKNMDTWASNRPGDPACAVIFPTAKEIIPSPTWQWAAAGIVDYRYVYTLEQAIRAAEGGSAEAKAAAKQATAKLETIKNMAPEYADTPFDFTSGAEDQWRRTVADEIIRLQKVK